MSLPLVDARTRLIAILGDPISHSISPRAQSFALARQNANALCLAFAAKPENLQQAVVGAQNLGACGVMITIPHKEAVLSLCDELHSSAQLVGAANLLEFRADGTICGHSSDGWAALESLRARNVEVRGARVAILGGGGSARSLALTFANAGAIEIALYNRTVERAQRIAEEVQTRLNTQARAFELGAFNGQDADILVNTTSIGMTPNAEATPLDARHIEARHTLFDIVYNPLETRLLREARACGAKTVDGLDMVLGTNVYAAKTCLNVEITLSDLREEALRALEKRDA